MISFKKQVVLLATIAWLTIGCKKDKNPQDQASFQRKPMLENYANQLIIPAYQELSLAVDTLVVQIDSFINSPNATSLLQAQQAWTNAYITFQYANAYNFGPAGEQGLNKSLVEEIGTFPVSPSKIEQAISNNSFNFNDFNRDARGFLTIEYLLFANDPQTTITNFQDTIRQNYLNQCAQNLKQRIQNVLNAWNNGYKNDFINDESTSAGSSTSNLYNEFVKSFESIKNYKLGLPLGKRPGQTQPEPTLVEAYYSKQSKLFYEHHLKAIENIWHGKNKNGQDGTGFYEYLQSVEGGSTLIQNTLNQWQNIMNVAAQVPNSPDISTQIIQAPAPLEALHTELQKHTRFFKSDMSSLLGIYITYSSGDGD